MVGLIATRCNERDFWSTWLRDHQFPLSCVLAPGQPLPSSVSLWLVVLDYQTALVSVAPWIEHAATPWLLIAARPLFRPICLPHLRAVFTPRQATTLLAPTLTLATTLQDGLLLSTAQPKGDCYVTA